MTDERKPSLARTRSDYDVSTSKSSIDLSDTIRSIPSHHGHQRHSTKEQMVVKIGIVGDQNVGKSSFMRRYVSQSFTHSPSEYYNNSPGSVLFEEKQIHMQTVDLYLGLWCSTTSYYESALQLICSGANVVIFMFSLTDKQSLLSIKSWHDKVLAQNTDFIPILVGTKYDIIHETIASNNPLSHHYLNGYHKITKIARKYAMKMRASLIYISSKADININHVIKVCVAKVFNIKPKLRESHWDTLKALREHNIPKLLKIWSSEQKMNCLIHGYLKRTNLNRLSFVARRPNIINVILLSYLKYDLLPLSHHHHHHHREGRKRKSSAKHGRLRRIKSEVKRRSVSKKKRNSKKRRKSSTNMKTKCKSYPTPPVTIPSPFGSGLTIRNYDGYDMVIEGPIQLKGR